MSLEIIARLSHFHLQQNPDDFDEIAEGMNPTIHNAVNDANAIPALLRNMRPLINSVNEKNPNVFSFKVQRFRIGTNWKPIDTERVLDSDGWVDICKESVCYNLCEEEALIRFKFQSIQRIFFAAESNTVQVSNVFEDYKNSFFNLLLVV